MRAKSPRGPRYEPSQTDAERHGFDNLLLLCPTHHDVADFDKAAYSVARLLEIKRSHETSVRPAPEPSDEIAMQFLAALQVSGPGSTVVISHKQSGGITVGTVITLASERATALMAFQETRHILATEPWPTNPWLPSWDDLSAGGLPRNQDEINRIIDLLQHGPVIIVAPPNRGKTFLSFLVSRAMADAQRYTTRQLFARASALDVGAAQAEVLAERNRVKEQRAAGSTCCHLCVVDDCHLNDDVAEALVPLAAPPGLALLLTLRGESKDDLPSWALDIHYQHPDRVIFIKPEPSFAIDIARAYIRRSGCPEQSDDALKALLNVLGSDLARLAYALRAWRTRCMEIDLSKIDEDAILRFTRDEFGIEPHHPDLCATLQMLATFGKRELPVPATLLVPKLSEAVATLVDRGVVSQKLGTAGGYALKDIKTCEWVLKAVERFCVNLSSQTEAELVVAFVTKSPAYHTYQLLRSLGAEHAQHAIRALFESQEAISKVRESLEGRGSTSLNNTLYGLVRGLPKRDRDKVAPLLTPNTISALTNGIRGAPAYRIRHAMHVLARIAHLTKFFEDWSAADWLSTINKSTVNTLRLLCLDFRMWSVPQLIRALGERLPEADFDALLDPDRNELGELNGLIGNLKQDAPETVPPLLRQLVGRDVGALMRNARPGDVSWLISQILLLDEPKAAAQFVTANEAILAQVLTTAPVPDQFWLLCNIFQAAQDVAISIARAGPVLAQLPESGDSIYLAACGLLLLCGRTLPAIELPEHEHLQAILSSEKSPTLLALSLKALAALGRADYAKDAVTVLGQESLRERFDAFPVSSTRKLMLRILTECS